MKSITVYNCTTFNVDETISVMQDENIIGTITPKGDELTINRLGFQPYNCTYSITVEEAILARDATTGTYIPAEEYKKSTEFPAFYQPSNHLLFVLIPNPIAKEFTKALTSSYPNRFAGFVPMEFDFHEVSIFQNRAKGIYFNVDDTTVDSKHFFGTDVNQDNEVTEAINHEQATYLIAQLDVAGSERTIGFGRKGNIVLYSKPNYHPNPETPYMQLCVDTLDNLNLLRRT